MDIPLLIYNHQKQLRIIFSPQKNTSEAENQGILDSLLRVLSENLDGKFKNEWVEDVAIFPKIVLPTLLPEPKKTAPKAKTADENDDHTSTTESEMLLLERFPEIETLEEKYKFLKDHPDFFSDKNIKIFEEFVELSIKESNQYNADEFGKDLLLLKKCQSLGVDQAFEDLNDPYALFEEAQHLADQYLETPNNISLLSRQMEIYSHLFNLYAENDLP